MVEAVNSGAGSRIEGLENGLSWEYCLLQGTGI
jgi:hypothetical protein